MTRRGIVGFTIGAKFYEKGLPIFDGYDAVGFADVVELLVVAKIFVFFGQLVSFLGQEGVILVSHLVTEAAVVVVIGAGVEKEKKY